MRAFITSLGHMPQLRAPSLSDECKLSTGKTATYDWLPLWPPTCIFYGLYEMETYGLHRRCDTKKNLSNFCQSAHRNHSADLDGNRSRCRYVHPAAADHRSRQDGASLFANHVVLARSPYPHRRFPRLVVRL